MSPMYHPELSDQPDIVQKRDGRPPQTNQTNDSIQRDEAMAEAVRKILRFQFREMLAHEDGSRCGENIIHVHDMRVATRRMRAALRLFGGYFEYETAWGFKQNLRATGKALGGVRDLDVFAKKIYQYVAVLHPEGEAAEPALRGDGMQELTPLLDHLQAQRQEARQQLIAYLDSDSYKQFVADFGHFVDTPGAAVLQGDRPLVHRYEQSFSPAQAQTQGDGEVSRVQVRHVLTSTVWQLYEKVRCYEVVIAEALPPTLHALRIDCKRLRYTLEFFRDLLGPRTGRLIKRVIAVQDHLGDLQDAVVADALLHDFVSQWQERSKSFRLTSTSMVGTNDGLAGVEAYRRYRQEEARRLLQEAPAVFRQRLNVPGFRRRLGEALLVL